VSIKRDLKPVNKYHTLNKLQEMPHAPNSIYDPANGDLLCDGLDGARIWFVSQDWKCQIADPGVYAV
jgi:hypothetical protein